MHVGIDVAQDAAQPDRPSDGRELGGSAVPDPAQRAALATQTVLARERLAGVDVTGQVDGAPGKVLGIYALEEALAGSGRVTEAAQDPRGPEPDDPVSDEIPFIVERAGGGEGGGKIHRRGE